MQELRHAHCLCHRLLSAGRYCRPGRTGRTGTLAIYYIDIEGGQSTLFVGPAGESLLVDTGNAGDRDLGRIAETPRSAVYRPRSSAGDVMSWSQLCDPLGNRMLSTTVSALPVLTLFSSSRR